MNSGHIKVGDLVSFRVTKIEKFDFRDFYNSSMSFEPLKQTEKTVARRVIKVGDGVVYVWLDKKLTGLSHRDCRKVY